MTAISVSPSAARSSTDSKGNPWITSFAVVGDFGDVATKSNNPYEQFPANYVAEAIRNFAPDFIISLGDDNYVEGKREWKDFNTGKLYAPFISPYTVLRANSSDKNANAIGSPAYLSKQVPRRSWNRFFTTPGNHEVGMSGGKGTMEASGRRDWSHDAYYKAAFEASKKQGSLTPIAGSYVKPGDILYYDYSYGTAWMPQTYFRKKEGAMAPDFYDYIVNPINKNGEVQKSLANIYMVDRNNAAYATDNSAYSEWRKKNPSAVLDPQADFLMKELKKRDNDVSWQIFASHYQTYSSDGSQAGMQLPFFKNGADLVIGAHVHNYERIKAADSAGITGDYIVNGTGGYNTSYTGNNTMDGLFSPIGTVDGYKKGSSGKWGFGVIDMNKDELQYRQFTVDFTPERIGNLGLATTAYKGKEPVQNVKITEIDRLILKKNVPSTALVSLAGKVESSPILSNTPITTNVIHPMGVTPALAI